MFQTLYDEFLGRLQDNVNGMAAEMSAQIADPFLVGALLYIVFYGFALVRGSINGSAVDLAVQALKLSVIYTLVANAGVYSTWVTTTVTDTLPNFVARLTGGDEATLPADGVIARAGIVAEELKEQYAAFNLPGKIYATGMSIVIYGVAGLFGGVAVVVSLVAYFGLSLMAALGPLFIAFALFDFSRGWFFGWLSQIINFAVVQLIVTLLAIFAVDFIGALYTARTAYDAAQSAVYMLTGLTVVTLFFFLAPPIAASLVGGAQPSTGVMQRFVERSLTRGGSPGDRNKTSGGTPSSSRGRIDRR